MWNVVGILYPGLYAYLVEVTVPPVLPPGVCLTSGVKVKYLVQSGTVFCQMGAMAGIKARSVTSTMEQTVLVVACVDVKGKVAHEAVECHGFVTSGIAVRYLEPSVTLPPVVCAEVAVRYLGAAAIDCTAKDVVADVKVRPKVMASGLKFCCSEAKK